ncbi:MAG: DUF4347 domain-containing protein, partial [Planctomycetales bacterium]|nr:DUF4347 domain-containing protein [Planctomycetales bacterium]
MLALEDRVLFSASPVADEDVDLSFTDADWDIHHSDNVTDDFWQAFDDVENALRIEFEDFSADSLLTDNASVDRRELIVVDTSVTDFERLLAEIQTQSDSITQYEILLLNPADDGVQQIADALKSLGGVDALHVLSHADEGSLLLGSERLTDANLVEHANGLLDWRANLRDGADILLYGCDLAGNESGLSLLQGLHDLTGADIAASNDTTGNTAASGDWDLEVGIGSIQTEVLHAEAWDGKLAVILVDTLSDVIDAGDGFTSLREAIIQANANADADEIRLTVAGTYILTLTGELEDLAATGDLDILNDLTIVGLDANSTIVDANHLDRVFDVAAGIQVSFSKLSIINGDATVGNPSGVGGGIRDSGATIELEEVIFSGNHADVGGGIRSIGMVTANEVYFHSNTAITYGGAIRNQGNLTISNATFADNSADQGGAIENRNGTLSLTNATFANNTATTGDGGAIFNTGQVSLQNVTIADNTAQLVGGGINNQAGGVVNLANTLVANNFGSGGSVDDDLSGAFSSNGSNFVRTVGSATGLQPADITNTDPLLGTLAANGGFAPTMRLLSTSLAIDGGNTTGAPTTDQTGELRDAAPDIGAYEYRPAVEFEPTGDLQVNVTTSSQQVTSSEVRGSRQAIAIDQNGNYVVVWSSNQTSGADGNGYGVMARMYDSSGTALTSEFLVNQTIAGNQQWAQVARADDGSFVITWTSNNGTDNDVYYRVYNADGTARTNEILANVTTAGNQENASVSINRNTGDFVIAWEGAGASDSDGVFFRRFDANGNALDGAEIQANTASGDSESDTSVSMNRSGEFAVSWTGDGDLYVRKYASNGSALTSAIKTNTASNVSGQSVALRDSGDFIVAARSDVFLAWGTYYRVYNGDGSSAENWELVAYGNPTAPSISVDADGNYAIVFEGANDGDQSGIRARIYNADHSAYRTIDVSHFTTGDQVKASVAMGNLDNLVFAWSGNGESDTSGVFARQFGTRTDTLIRQASTSITVDGTVDGIWGGATSNSVSLLASGTIDNATDLSATWSSLWDSTYLYFLVDVDDDILEGTGTDHFTDDIVELFVGQQITGESTYDADEYHLGIRAIDNTLVIGPNSATDTTGILHAVTTNATGYTVEVAIPWTSLGVSPTSGHVIGLEVQVGDDDDGGTLDGELAWQDSTGQAANDPRVFGSATLVGVSNSAPDVTAGGPYVVGMGENLLLSEATAFDVDGDSLSFAWDLNGNGIFGETNEPTSASASISWTTLETMGVSSLGTNTIQLRADDGNGGVRISSTTFTVTAPERGLWFSSVGTGSSTDLPNFDAGTIVQLGGTGFALEPSAATAGQLSEVFDVDNFLSGADVNALHYVTTDISVGGGTFAAFDLVKGDVLFSLKGSGTLVSSNSLAVAKEDVVVFRPDTVGDFSSGSFFTLLDDPLGAEIRGVTLVESETHVGEATLTAGSFLLIRSGGAEDSNVYLFSANDVGAGSTSGTTQLLIDGADVGISDKLFGIELIESAVSLGGALLTEGQLVLAIDNDSSVGDNGLAVTRQDFFVLDVSQTSLSGIGAATASLLMDGSDVQLSDSNEAIDAIALFAKSSAPIAINDTATVTAGSAQTIDLTANDLDADGDIFQIVDIGSPTLGTVINNGNGTVTYTAVDGTDGNDSFTYVISDGSDGLTHFWGLNGNAIDSMGAADGTVNGATTVSGAYGDALQFDEINDYVSLPDITYNNEFTVSFKFKIDDNSGTEYQYMYSHGDVDGTESLNVLLGEWSNSSGYSGVMKTVFSDENDSYVINALNFNASSTVGTGWHTYTLTVDAINGARVYLDGELKASNASHGGDAFNPDGNLVLGSRDDLSSIRFMGGSLDSVAIFDRSLSLDEVSALTSDHLTTLATSAAQVSIDVNDIVDITSNLVLHLQLDDGIGTTAADSSVNGNDANLVGDQNWQVGAVGGGFHFDYSDG